jgi:Cu+-exporting ATPase
MRKVDTLLIDKTGTVTEGKFRVVEIKSLIPQADLFRYAASLERGSQHPLAAAIIAEAAHRRIDLAEAADFVSEPGFGIAGTVDGKRIILGSQALMKSRNIDTSQIEQMAGELRSRGQTVMYVSAENVCAGVIGISDTVKKSAAETIARLKNEGVETIMITGDHEEAARAIARETGVTKYQAGVLPAEKASIVRQYQEQGRVVAMAGDGINDAPALAQAQVGIAMGNGTDIAMQSAHVTLVRGDLDGILRARALSRATMRNIRQNLAFAFGYNMLGIPVAAGALYPVFGLLLSPVIAAAAMSFSSVSVISNALRLRKIKL